MLCVFFGAKFRTSGQVWLIALLDGSQSTYLTKLGEIKPCSDSPSLSLSLSLSLSQRRQTCSNSNVTYQHGYISCTIDVISRNHSTKSTSVHHKTNSKPTPNIFLEHKRTRTECRTFFGSSSSFVELRHFEASGQDGTQAVPKSGKIFTNAPAHTPNVARFYSPNTQITEQKTRSTRAQNCWKHPGNTDC
jgi:hypothetical protein